MRRVLLYATFSLFFIIIVYTSCTEKDKNQSYTSQKDTVFTYDAASYVGTESCRDCHQDVYQHYFRSDKAMAFGEDLTKSPTQVNWDQVVYDSASDFYYKPVKKDKSISFLEFRLNSFGDTIHKLSLEASHFVGSGSKNHTFLISVSDYLFEVPITWYSEKGIWDLSPGYEDGNNSRFSRPITETCLHCHVSDYQHTKHTINRYVKLGNDIGCEKCHGPGSSHIKNMQAGMRDVALPIMENLSAQAQIDVCRQCHLEGILSSENESKLSDFRPGQLLSDVTDVFVPVDANSKDFGFASHAERLQMSSCFKLSGKGSITCTTCHDAHGKKPQNPVKAYNQSCKSCHTAAHECSHITGELEIKEANCIECHMPKGGTSDIPHVSSRDHFIRVVDKTKKNEMQDSISEIKRLVRFTSSENDEKVLKAKAFLKYYAEHDKNTAYLKEVENFIHSLSTVEKLKFSYFKGSPFPNNLELEKLYNNSNPEILHYSAMILQRQGRSESFKFYKKAYEIAPLNRTYIADYAQALSREAQLEKSIEMHRKWAQKDSLNAKAWNNYGFQLLKASKIKLANSCFSNAISLNPDYFLAYENKARAALMMGNTQESISILQKLCRVNSSRIKQYEELIIKIKKSIN